MVRGAQSMCASPASGESAHGRLARRVRGSSCVKKKRRAWSRPGADGKETHAPYQFNRKTFFGLPERRGSAQRGVGVAFCVAVLLAGSSCLALALLTLLALRAYGVHDGMLGRRVGVRHETRRCGCAACGRGRAGAVFVLGACMI